MKFKTIYLIIPIVVVAISIVFVIKKEKTYDLVKPKVGPITEVIYGLGTVVSYHRFNFKLGIGKTLKELYVHEGQKVPKGTKLLKFEDGPAVISPFEGTVLSIPYNVGENIFADRVVITVEDLDHLYIETHLDQVASLRVRKGMKSRVSFENLRNEDIVGEVTAVYPSQGQFIAKVEVPSFPKEILAGMTADVAIEVATKEKAMVIPLKAINNKSVTVERSGKRMKLEVKLGIMDQEWVEDLSGQIQSSDLIVVKK